MWFVFFGRRALFVAFFVNKHCVLSCLALPLSAAVKDGLWFRPPCVFVSAHCPL